MSKEDPKKIITDYANHLLDLVNNGLANITPEDLQTIGGDIKRQRKEVDNSVATYREYYEVKQAQEAVAPVREQVEAFIDSPKRPRVIEHSDADERSSLKRGTTKLMHLVYIPMDDRSGAAILKAQDALMEQYKGFPKSSVHVGGDSDPDAGTYAIATIDLSKPGVKEAAEEALAALEQAPAAGRTKAIDPEQVKKSRSDKRAQQ